MAEFDHDPKGGTVSCLSVRSGLDALLSTVDWPTGSEILMSAVNIAAMASIVAGHGFVPVPVDVSVSTLASDIQHIEGRITPKTRAILVAHLFGSCLELGSVRKIADARGVELWEDVAQGFHPSEFCVRSLANVSFFSFGLIKTHATLGGALIRCYDADRLARLRRHQSIWPHQRLSDYCRRVIRALLLKGAGQHLCYTVLCRILTALGCDIEVLMSDSVRSFKPGHLLKQIRHRPCPAQLRLLHRRLSDASLKAFQWKTPLVAEYNRLLPPEVQVGATRHFRDIGSIRSSVGSEKPCVADFGSAVLMPPFGALN